MSSIVCFQSSIVLFAWKKSFKNEISYWANKGWGWWLDCSWICWEQSVHYTVFGGELSPSEQFQKHYWTQIQTYFRQSYDSNLHCDVSVMVCDGTVRVSKLMVILLFPDVLHICDDDLESVIVPDFTLDEFKETIESLLNFSIISDVDDNNDFDYNNNSVDCEMDSLEHLISSLTSTVSSFFNVKAQTVSSTVFSTTVQTSSTTSPYFCQISNYNFFQDPNHNTITIYHVNTSLPYQIYRQNFYHWSVLQLQQILLYY